MAILVVDVMMAITVAVVAAVADSGACSINYGVKGSHIKRGG